MTLQDAPSSASRFHQRSWTDEESAQLKALWEKGLSATMIAREMGLATRNMVIGKAHRMGLGGRRSTVHAPEYRDGAKKGHRATNRGGDVALLGSFYLKPKPLPKLKISEAPFLGVALFDLERNQCRYPKGEETVLFCGQPQTDDSSYCAWCHKLTHGAWR